MREESHLDEMRSAIRGDFERLAERRGEQELMRVPDEQPEPENDEPNAAEAAEEPVLEAAGGVEPEPAPREVEPEPAPGPEPEPAVDPDGTPKPDDEPRRSWFARFFSP